MPIVTLEYHDVVEGENWASSGFPGNSADSYKMAASLFEAHLLAVGSVTNHIGPDVRDGNAAPPTGHTVLFTFDDGGASALHSIAERLERYGWRGHFLMTTARIGAAGFLGADDLRELQRRGHIIGSHSESHPSRMSLLSRSEQEGEWRRSRDTLEAILGAPVEVASVPGGYFDRQTAVTAAAAGIRWLFTSEPETRVNIVDGCAIIGRYTLRRDTPARVARALVGRSPHARMAQWLKWNAKKLVKRAAGDTYLRVRATLFRDTAT